MRILVIGHFHHKNEAGLNDILRHLGWQTKYGTEHDIPNYDMKGIGMLGKQKIGVYFRKSIRTRRESRV